MNQYIDNLTVKEYEEIHEFLKICEPILKLRAEETKDTKKYVELRFIDIKIQKIIKKYKKDLTSKLK